MNKLSARIALFFCLCLIPMFAFGADERLNTEIKSQLIAFFELILFITSLISLKQYFWPGLENKTPFHIFNMLFVIVFYTIALSFIMHNKSFYVGYSKLSDPEVLRKYFSSTEPLQLIKRLIFVAFVINILYIFRNGRNYFIEG